MRKIDPSIPIFQNPHLKGTTRFLQGSKNTGFLLIHGFTATTVEVSKLGEFFNDMGFFVSMPLLPGHGTTPEDLNNKRYHDWIDCAEAAYQELSSKVDQIIVGGESMGSVLSLLLASMHPEIRALLLYSPALVVPSLKLSRWIRLFKPIISKNNYDDEIPWQGYTVYPLNAAYEFFKLQKLVETKMPDINTPAAIFHGHFDKTIDKGVSHFILNNLGSNEKKIFQMENSGHVMLLDREFDRIACLSMEFLESNHIL